MVNTDGADAATSQSPTIARPKRSRTGCLTCRTRRRKCDEAKPICQNCISKDLECRYAATFQILGKNNFTPEVANTVKYVNVQFVGQEAASGNNDALGSNTEQYVSGQQVAQSNSHSPSPNSYEFALRGLIELGSGDGIDEASRLPRTHDRPTPMVDAGVIEYLPIDPVLSTPSVDFGNVDATLHGSVVHTRSTPSYTSISRLAEAGSTPTSSHGDVATLELLKYYRYHIAPWLDMYDSEQSFGVELVTLSSTDRQLREAVLTIARQAQGADITFGYDSWTDTGGSSQGYAGLYGAFWLVVCVFRSLTDFWQDEITYRKGFEATSSLLMKLNEGRPLDRAAYWLSIRLLLSSGMLKTEPFHIPLSPLEIDAIRPNINDPFAASIEAILALCVDALAFSDGADSSDLLQRRYTLPRAEIWNFLIDAFAKWYISRVQPLQPIIELYPKDGMSTTDDDDFPSIIFTNSGALFANQIYHTGMLLLLQHKPKFALRPISSSSSMSILWHAHRICGIAKQIGDRQSWDPCLIASLIVASKTITHGAQHELIVRTLEKAQILTGWDIQKHIDEMRTEWQDASN